MKIDNILGRREFEAIALAVALATGGCATPPANQKATAPSPTPGTKSTAKQPAVQACAPLPAVSGTVCRVQPGTSQYFLIAGQVLTPDTTYDGGGVLVGPDGKIAAVGCDALARAAQLGATQVICPSASISPGLINTHDHISYNWNAPGRWGTERYDRRNQWRKGIEGHTRIRADPGTDEQTAWSELRHVLAGTTSIAGSGGHSGLVRNLDKPNLLEGLQTDYANYSTFPLGDVTDVTPHMSDCNYPKIDDPGLVLSHQCYLPHMAEGVDLAANNEIRCMDQAKLITSKGAYVHSVAALGTDGQMLYQRGASVVWSPRSNIALYGNTAQVTMYANLGIKMALATDWSPSGSINLLRELQCADSYNTRNLDGFFSDYDLWMMVTANAADAVHVNGQIGRLAPGLVADIAVFSGPSGATPYRRVLNANVDSVSLVVRGGIPLYGDTNIFLQVPNWASDCEPLPGGVLGSNKTLCTKRELGESFAQLQSNNIKSYPLFFAGIPDNEPTCIPSRLAVPGKEAGYTGLSTAGDYDGDGVPDKLDNCPMIFNPIRPVDNGKQADCNNNGIGDACDPTPCK